MKKIYFLFLFALIASVSNLWATEVVIWEEDFSSNSLTGYTTSGTGTKIYKDNIAKGTSPELLIYKTNGSFQVSISDLKGCTGTLTLTFKCNKSNSQFAKVTSSTSGVTVSTPNYSDGVWTTVFTVPDNAESLTFKVSNTNSSNNGRYDDFKLVGTKEETQCAKPTFNLDNNGEYTDAKTLEISTATEGATIEYTIDGVETGKQTGSGVSPVSIPLTANDIYTVTATATKDGLDDSEPAEIAFTIDKKCAAPTFNLDNNGEYTDALTLEISSTTEGATIEYTIKGGEITTITGSATSKASIPLTANDIYEVTAKVVKEGYAEAEETIMFTIEKKCDAPTFNLTKGATYGDVQTLEISTATAGAKIEYTIVGGGDINISATDEAPVKVNLAQNGKYVVEAYAVKDDYLKSEKAELTFKIDLATGVPTFSVEPGTYKEAQSIVLTPGEGGEKVMYKINDADDFLPYTDPIELTEDGTYTISAYTEATVALAKSEEVTKTYVIVLPLSEPYILCENAAWLTDGAKIIFVGENATNGNFFGMSTQPNKSDNYRSQASVELDKDNNMVSKDATVSVFTVVKNGNNLAFKDAEGYIYNDNTQNTLKTNETLTDNCYWNVTIANNGVATVKSTTSNTYAYLRYNPSAKRFAAYKQNIVNDISIYLLGSTSSVSTVAAENGVKVVAVEGGVEVVANEAADVAVYTVAGQLVRSERVAEGSTLINLPAGFYVVRAAGAAAKVIVK